MSEMKNVLDSDGFTIFFDTVQTGFKDKMYGYSGDEFQKVNTKGPKAIIIQNYCSTHIAL